LSDYLLVKEDSAPWNTREDNIRMDLSRVWRCRLVTSGWVWRCRLVTSGSGQEPVADCFEYGN